MTAPMAEPRPDADPRPLTDADRRAALLAALDDEQRQLAALRDVADALMGQSDSDSLLERELAERGATNTLRVIADIQRALAGLEDGTYGRCEGCGQPIAPARLEAIPHARVCVSCPSPAG
jgi:RNA polymerase-binding transcription factor DksA